MMTMKYRRLSPEELSALEKEFIKFLIINGIDASEWVKINELDNKKANEMIDTFSDLVFEGIISKVVYIEYFDQDGLKLFKCEDDTIYLTGISSPIIFAKIEDMINHLSIHPELYSIYHTSKTYLPDKSTEIFRMIDTGGIVTDGKYYETLSKY